MLRFEGVVTAEGEEPLDLEVAGGTGVALVGPSGGARTRLLAAVAGPLRLRSGRILLDGAPPAPTGVGFVDEDRSLLGGLTAVENVATRALLRGPLQDGDWRSIEALLLRLGLPGSSLHNLAEQLSGGQQQRVAVGRALFGAPAVLCLDDPVSELDDASAEVVWSVVAEHVRAGAVLLLGLPEPDPAAPAERSLRVSAAARQRR